MMNMMDRWDNSSLTFAGRCSTSYPTWASVGSWQLFPTTSASQPLRESYTPSLDPTLLSTLIVATPAIFPLHLQLEIAWDLTLPMALDLLHCQVTTSALLPLTSETHPSVAFLLLLPGSLEPLWRVDLPFSEPSRHPHLSPPPLLTPPTIAPALDSYPAIPVAVTPISNSTAQTTFAQAVTLLPPDTTSPDVWSASTSLTKDLLQTMALSVMEFIGLHDIPYIFLSSDTQPYLFIDEFLASLDQYWNLSSFIPNALFP